MTDLLELWNKKGRPAIPIDAGTTLVDLERFLSAGPGPLPQHERRYQWALEKAWDFLKE